jgi:hypothetical protein
VNGTYNSNKTSSDVYGLNANYQLNDPMSTVFETYLFTRFNGDHNGTAAGGTGSTITDKGDTLYVPGLRASTNPIKGLNVQGEFAWQLGNHPVVDGTLQQAERRSAMAAQLLASYSLPVLDKYKPTVNASYTYVSGDKNGADVYGAGQSGNQSNAKSAKTYTAWDQFNEIQGSGTIYNTLYNLTNMHIVSAGASINPLEDVTAAATWSGLWAADQYSAQNPLVLIEPDGTTVNPSTTTGGKKKTGLGNEYDVNFTYNYTEDVTFGVSLGWYVPGDALTKDNRNTASQALASVGVKF